MWLNIRKIQVSLQLRLHGFDTPHVRLQGAGEGIKLFKSLPSELQKKNFEFIRQFQW
jgi:hypothetical protein